MLVCVCVCVCARTALCFVHYSFIHTKHTYIHTLPCTSNVTTKRQNTYTTHIHTYVHTYTHSPAQQMLQPNEKIDMPVFFFIDPSYLDDRRMDLVDTITLSYTFFKAGEADAPGKATTEIVVLE